MKQVETETSVDEDGNANIADLLAIAISYYIE